MIEEESDIEQVFPNNDAIVSSSRILYTPSSFAKASLLYLQAVGTLRALKPHISKHSGLSSYLFFLVKDGCGRIEYDGCEYNVKRGDCVFVDCKQNFLHETSADEPWELQWCHFFGVTATLIYEKYMERGGAPVFKPNEADTYLEILDDLFAIASSNDYIRDMRINEKIASLLTLLMIESWQIKENSNHRRSHKSVNSIKEYLDNNYSQKITLDALSREFYISKNYLTRLFKEQYGISVIDYLQVVRITHAKRLLKTTNMSVEQIGLEAGFSSLHYFSRAFKKIEGISPTVFREQWEYGVQAEIL